MKIVLVGNGNMGKILFSLAKEQIVKVIENFTCDYIEDELMFDVIIDFSNRENLDYIIREAKKRKCKLVIATTNLNDEDYRKLKELANETAILIDSNFSYGILIMKKIIKDNLLLLNNYDIEVEEVHHKYKKDAPSGTAKSIINIIEDEKLNYDINVIRKGTIRGEHKIVFYGDEEFIEIKHTALSRKIYALGALEAAKWLLCKEKGLFSYGDCVFNNN